MPHIEMIRIGSRLPIALPQRITEGLKKAIGGLLMTGVGTLHSFDN